MNKKSPKTGSASPETADAPRADASAGRRTPAMRNISRKGHGHETTWWQVDLSRSSPKHRYTKTFSNSRYGGEAESLAAAQAWRDEMERLHPRLTPMDRLALLKKNNTSGKLGVSRDVKVFRLRDGRERRVFFWKAHTPSWVIPYQSKRFSFAKYGEEEAYRLAVAARTAFETDAGEAAHQAIVRKTTGRHSPEMRCICRRGRGQCDVWCVRVKRGGTLSGCSKTFRDSQYGGEKPALVAAQAWRDEIERQHPKQTKQQRASQLTQANTSGKTGVVQTLKLKRRLDGSAKVTSFWMAQAPFSANPRRNRLFSTEKFGEREAYRLAVEARLAFEALLDDTA